MSRRVAVTGLGVITSAGDSIQKLWENVVSGRSHVKEMDKALFRDMRSSISGVVEGIEASSEENGRALAFAEWSIVEALVDACLKGESLHECGIILASANGSMDMLEKYFRDCNENVEYLYKYPMSYLLDQIIDRFEFEGSSSIVSTACASSNLAITAAYDLIQRGIAKRVVICGTEVISTTIFAGFNSLRAVSLNGCAPFDKNRDGMFIGEGAACLVLEDMEEALNRGIHIYCEISGYGMSCDASSMTNPNGIGLKQALENAIVNNYIPIEDIDYINAHGTATPANDAAEIAAIKKIFGNHKSVSVSSTKPIHGHMLGASGAIEAVVSILALSKGIIPFNVNLKLPEDDSLDFVMDTCREKEIKYAISSSQAFGGSNSVLVFKRIDENV